MDFNPAEGPPTSNCRIPEPASNITQRLGSGTGIIVNEYKCSTSLISEVFERAGWIQKARIFESNANDVAQDIRRYDFTSGRWFEIRKWTEGFIDNRKM